MFFGCSVVDDDSLMFVAPRSETRGEFGTSRRSHRRAWSWLAGVRDERGVMCGLTNGRDFPVPN
jgi:hypothetical protein